MRVLIDPGHGGEQVAGRSSPIGVRGPGGTAEKDVVLALARRVRVHLGPDAALTRSDDRNLSLRERAAAARGSAVLVSLHAAGGAEPGAQTWVHSRAGQGSRALAQAIQRELGGCSCGAGAIRSSELALLTPELLRQETAACIVEVDALGDREGERRLRDPRHLDALAAAIARGVRRYSGMRPAERAVALDMVELNAGDAFDRASPPYLEWVQRSLNDLSGANLGVDGETGPATQGAVRQFQQDHGLNPTGRVDDATETALVGAGAAAAPTMPAITASGIDFNADLRPSLSCWRTAQWKNLPISFAVRYYSSFPQKNLTPLEAQALSEAGIECVVVWEDAGGTVAYFSRARGEAHGQAAVQQAIHVDQPSGRPIYFAIDNVDPMSAADRAQIGEYFEGVRDGMARALATPEGTAAGVSYPVGVYGAWNVLDWCRDQGIATWFWQSCSTGTSGGKSRFLWPDANLRQVRCEKMMCGLSVDVNEAYRDAGGWLRPVAPWQDYPSTTPPRDVAAGMAKTHLTRFSEKTHLTRFSRA
jgi:peptidoglycan hydrolase-like protein with peptidoglycan-binding domain